MYTGIAIPSYRRSAWLLVLAVICCLLGSSLSSPAQPAYSFSNTLAQADAACHQGDLAKALDIYAQVQTLEATNAPHLCALTKRYCDLMHDRTNNAHQAELARRALAAALQAVQADPLSVTSHLCVAICYAKNFPFVDLRTKIAYSRGIKTEAEKALALDPRQDIAYYLLGRWHTGVANMGFFAHGIVKVVYGGLPHASNADAIACFQKALALAPNRIIHHAGLFRAYAAAGENDLAHQELETCQRLTPVDQDDADARKFALAALASWPHPIPDTL